MTEGRSVLIAHPSADLYGSDRVMLETVEAMGERGWQVTVTLPAPGPLVQELERRGARVVYCPSPVLRKSFLSPLGLVKMVGQTLRSIPRSVGLIRRSKADLVYVSTLTIPLWLPVSRLLRRPVVCHVHESERSVHPLVRRALAAPLLLATALIVNSEYSKGVLTESFRRLGARSEVIYNGVPGPDDVVKARNALQQPIRMLFVGRLSPRKGPQVAVELVRLLADRGVDTQLQLLGSVFPGYEWFEEELHESAAGSDNRVEFAGFVPEVWSHVAAADVVLVPSQGDEPFGNTAVEAVLAARPVVVSASSGLDEAVAGYSSAHSVPAADLNAWADAVVEISEGWTEYRNLAWDDAATAAKRHSPARYRERVERRLSELSRS